MIPDAETLCIIVEVMTGLGLGQDFKIKLNHRKILDGMFAVVGVPADKIRSISSAVDKLDKSPWAEVKKEMEEKGLEPEVADRIWEYVQHNGDLATIINLLKNDPQASANPDVKKGLDDMDLLLNYAEAFQITDKISFDLSLARGLDYYTGLIYETVTTLPPDSRSKASSDEAQVGSVAAGGRYDNLVGMFGKTQIPCVGVSFGIDRLFTILKYRRERERKQGKEQQLREREVDVFVMAFGGKGSNGLLVERMTVARELWTAGIRAEYSAKVKPRLPQQFKAAETGGVPLAIILGEDELAAAQVRLKVLGLPDDHPEKEGRLIPRQDLVEEVNKLL